jgi:hypothetical protein
MRVKSIAAAVLLLPQLIPLPAQISSVTSVVLGLPYFVVFSDTQAIKHNVKADFKATTVWRGMEDCVHLMNFMFCITCFYT